MDTTTRKEIQRRYKNLEEALQTLKSSSWWHKLFKTKVYKKRVQDLQTTHEAVRDLGLDTLIHPEVLSLTPQLLEASLYLFLKT